LLLYHFSAHGVQKRKNAQNLCAFCRRRADSPAAPGGGRRRAAWHLRGAR